MVTESLSAILRDVKGDRCVMTVTVIYSDNGQQLTLNSYRADGAETVLEYAERIRFTSTQFDSAMRNAGWGMDDRPVKMGMNFRYILKRNADTRYTANAASHEQMERWAQRKVMREIAVADEMEREFAGL